MSSSFNSQAIQKEIKTKAGNFSIFQLGKIKDFGFNDPHNLPFSIKVLLESALRNFDNYQVTLNDIKRLSSWSPSGLPVEEIAFKPGRVILQDFTGVPCVVDLAAMRSAMKRMGGDYLKINPLVMCDLVIDHSVQVDSYGTAGAYKENLVKEFERNQERYEFLKWGQKAFKNFRVVPPATGIVHQVNLEYLAQGVLKKKLDGATVVYPDSLVGTDSHTTMINGLGIVGWGVGGIEAEAVMLGEPIYMLLPEVIGFKVIGHLTEGVTATDLVLTVTQMLRKKGVVGKFVEFFGEGLKNLTLPDRATIANMAPEYGATIGFFPIDDETLSYYHMTGRLESEIDLIKTYMKEQDMFYAPGQFDIKYTSTLELDLSKVVPSLAGPKRPQDRVSLVDVKDNFKTSLKETVANRGFGLTDAELIKTAAFENGKHIDLTHGAVVIAAITSCTNTSNPSVLIAAGILARNAVNRGLKIEKYVKTSFAPGSRTVDDYLTQAGLMTYLDQLGFNIVGYGCTTCIGNSGPIPQKVADAIQKGDLVAASVLSGNRNFEGRINPLTRANYLASPPLVVAYALAGKIDINLEKEPLGKDQSGNDVYLKDIWPTQEEIKKTISKVVTPEIFKKNYQDVLEGNEDWNKIKITESELYEWKKDSTYIQEPPFFENMKNSPEPIKEIKGAKVLIMVGDSITTDHISPAGSISEKSPAGTYLKSLGISAVDFNSYGARRGNDRVMTRGTFANVRFRNQMAPGTEGSWTTYLPTNEKMSIFDASLKYKADKTPLMVLAGKEYGTGSSRDWAAKGPALLGINAVIAQSYERIHRSNLVGMGILPLEFLEGESAESLGLKGTESFDIVGISDQMKARQQITVIARGEGSSKEFKTLSRIDTPVEIDYYRNGGILQTVLRKLAKA